MGFLEEYSRQFLRRNQLCWEDQMGGHLKEILQLFFVIVFYSSFNLGY